MDWNIISVNLTGQLVCRTSPVYQYNSGMILKIVGPELPSAYTVDFANSVTGSSVSQVGNSDGVVIPDQFFTPGSTIHAWVVLTGADYVVTRYHIMIPISPRAARTNEEPTPSQQSALDEAIAALNQAVEDAEAAASHYPKVEGGYWMVWDVEAGEYVSTGVQAHGPQGDVGPAWEDDTNRVTSLDTTVFGRNHTIEAVGSPVYVSDVSQYSSFGLTDTGWYIFARIAAKSGVTVSAQTTVTGAAGYIATVGADHVDVAVRFGTTAQSQTVTVTWATGNAETFIFKATDLAVFNLDYRTTFYLYDLDDYVTWTYALTSDATFATGKRYFTEENGVYTEAIEGTDWTAGDAVTADTYYNHSKVTFSGMTKNVTYKFDQIIDCPIEIVLPVVTDAGYGAWFEIQLRYNGSYSCTLLPPEGVKIGTVSTQSQTAGINVIDLQYTGVGGVQMWSLLNTHSNIPA